MVKINESNMRVILKLAAEQCLDEDVAAFDALDISDITVSRKTRNRVLRAASKAQTDASWHIFTQVLKKAAVICLVTVSLLFAAAMSIEPVRAAFWEAIVTWYDEYIGINFDYEDEGYIPTKIERVILPDIPEGWETVELTSDSVTVFYMIYGTEGEYITYQQMTSDDGEIWVDNTDCIFEMILLNEKYDAYLCTHNDGRYQIIWKNRYVFAISGENVDLDVLIGIAETINKKNNLI